MNRILLRSPRVVAAGILLGSILLALGVPDAASAQRLSADNVPRTSLGAPALDDLGLDPVTPRGAFIRSLLIPGWGQMASGAPARGAFYVGVQGGSYWMLGRTLLRQRHAIRFRDQVEEEIMADLMLRGVQRPDSLSFLAGQDPRYLQRDSLVDIRGGQVEDWIALSIFLAFLSATDALVSSHMARFPEPLGMSPSAARRQDGGWELRVELPWP
jgi:hypothetical protein